MALLPAYRLSSGRSIAPFGDAPRKLCVGTRPIEAWQAEACRAAGLELVDLEDPRQNKPHSGPAIIFWDDVFFTEMALRQFVADTLRATEPSILALPDSPAGRALAPLSTARKLEGGAHAFDVLFLPDAQLIATTDRADLRELARPVMLAIKERALPVRLPREEKTVEAPLTARIVCHVEHWLHLLRLSQLSIGVALLDALKRDPWRIFGLRWASRRGGPWAVARKLVFVHPTAEVHPTADLEACVIGPGSVIRAHAHVHSSVIGSGVELGDHAVVVGCALADGVQVLRASYLAHCAAMEKATLASYKVQLSLFGRSSFLTTSALLLDAKLEGDVSVEHEGQIVSLGTPFLGACVGHRSAIGAQVAIAPGRAVPNDTVLVGHEVALRFPADAAGKVWTVREEGVVPLRSSR